MKEGRWKMEKKFIQIRDDLKRVLKPSRYEHSIGVCYTAVALAMRYQCNLYQAQLAGLLHDCARQYDNEFIYQQCLELGIPVSDSEEKNKILLHAKYGSYLAKNQYGISDAEILNAITFHTTGKPDMTLLEKIVFLADYIEPRRNHSSNLPKIRQVAFINIDEAVYLTMHDTLEYLRSLPDSVYDPLTEEAFLYYKKLYHHM
jgi:predicted HD superfamily hydrolase involved in NAD metabolism